MPPVNTKVLPANLPKPMWEDDDRPRTRLTDSDTSHAAADKSQRGLSAVRVAVLRIVAATPAGLTGSEINSEYSERVERGVLPLVQPDTPRKRAGELAASGYLVRLGRRPGVYGTAETVYGVSVDGLDYLHRHGREVFTVNGRAYPVGGVVPQ